MSEMTVESYKKAYRKVMMEKERKGFLVHAILFGAVNTGLITLNLLVVPQFLWFFFPLAGWGAGLTAHYLGSRKYPKHLEQDEIKAEKLAQKDWT